MLTMLLHSPLWNFGKNIATYFAIGGALHSKSHNKFENNCAIRFNCNEATQGGAIFAESDTVFKDIKVW